MAVAVAPRPRPLFCCCAMAPAPGDNGREEIEVFMMVRHYEIDFNSGALVFPGGSGRTGEIKRYCAARALCRRRGARSRRC